MYKTYPKCKFLYVNKCDYFGSKGFGEKILGKYMWLWCDQELSLHGNIYWKMYGNLLGLSQNIQHIT